MAFTKNQSAVAELYIAALGRSPEKAGLDYWVGRLESTGEDALTIEEIQTKFFDPATSSEVAARFPATQTDAEYIEAIYVNVFGRASDAEGKAFWEAKIASGSTKAEIMAEMLVAAKASTNDAAALAADLAAAETAYDAEAAEADTAPEATALATLAAANDAVSTQEDAIATFLEESFSNEFVEDATVDGDGLTNDVVGTKDASDVNQADITDAHLATAGDLITASNGSITVAARDFNDLTDAQQDARIASTIVDLEEAIVAQKALVTSAAEDLESGVATLVATASTKSDALVTALDAEDAQDVITAEASDAASAVATDSVGGTPAAVTVSSDLGTVNVNDGTDSADITQISPAGVVSFTDAVVLNATTGIYTITIGAGVTTTITKSYLDAVLVAAQADVDADKAVTSAEKALATAVVNVLEAQDSTFDGSKTTFASLVNDGAIKVTNNVGAADEVVLDYSAAKEVLPVGTDTAVNAAAVDTYASELSSQAYAEEALVTFNEALADWKTTEILVDNLKALNDTLGVDGDAADEGTLFGDVTAATEAITNATDDADAPGLGLSLVSLDGAVSGTTDESDIFLYEGETSTVSDFESEFDSMFIGTNYTLLLAAEDADITTDNLGDVSVLEAIIIDNGTSTSIYFEDETFGGNGEGDANVTLVTLTGVTGMDLSVDANGFLTVA